MKAEIKNLKKVAERISKAVKKKERILLYGDADLDGVSATIILQEAIQNLGGEISAVYFPDRETEGYGISKIGLNYLKKFSPALLIAIDCGIGNFKEIKLAKKIGLKTIVIDHHEILDKLPEAKIIVDPKQKGDKYPFKGLATAGIVFKLSEVLLNKQFTPLEITKTERKHRTNKSLTGFTDSLRKSFLELVALATIADMMPQENENEVFIKEGLSSLEHSWRPGIRAFFETAPLFYQESGIKFLPKVSKIISILNVRDVENNLPASFRLLTTLSLTQAKELILRLKEKSQVRKEKIKKIIEEIENRTLGRKEPIVFEGDSNWEVSLISPIASILTQKLKKPIFIFKKLKEESQGTVRVPPGINSVALMKKCKKYLITYGGHPPASGFRIKNKNLEKFRECLLKHFKPHAN